MHCLCIATNTHAPRAFQFVAAAAARACCCDDARDAAAKFRSTCYCCSSIVLPETGRCVIVDLKHSNEAGMAVRSGVCIWRPHLCRCGRSVPAYAYRRSLLPVLALGTAVRSNTRTLTTSTVSLLNLVVCRSYYSSTGTISVPLIYYCINFGINFSTTRSTKGTSVQRVDSTAVPVLLHYKYRY